ncbi:MAG: methylated-DNA--[protein]-cysteine S-methyltransferase [Gemmatimonadetes bacterium]|nr:methylated-DNA--[protein]-cysteine S-methyltransferase [Gemmatimonadota bacterium]
MTLPEGTRPEAERALAADLDGAERDEAAVAWLRGRVCAYLEGLGQDLVDLPVDTADAPPFFKRAWTACRSIPAGETRSYGWLAAAAGSPGAARAAGQSMARNPAALAIPCHRVVASDGSLHGFGGGLEMKARLLALEAKGGRPGRRD